MNMKRYIIAALALVGFVTNCWADTDKLTAADGWTKITTVPTASEIANNYYVFVDATNDLMLGVAKGVHQNKQWYSLGAYYQTSVEPTSADINGKTWILESYNGGFSMRNLEYSVFMMQTEWGASWNFDTNDVTSPNEWSKINLNYLPNGYWTIENGQFTGGYIGPWDDGNFANGAECAGNKTDNAIGHFQIYAISRTQFKQNLLDNASASNPVDITPWYVTNPTFDGGNRNGWTEEGSDGNNNTHARGGGCEIWHRSNFKIYQDLTVLNGKYKVSLQMAGTSGAGKVYGTSNGTTKEAASSAAAGSDFQNTILSMIQDRTFGQTITDEITVSNGSLTIGMKCETTDQWINFDNFKLYCTGLDLSAYQEQLADLVDDCNNFIDSHVVPTACETAISNAITTYNKSYETAKEYSVAIVALTTVLESYSNNTALQSAYAEYKAFRTNVQELENTSIYHYTDGSGAKTTLDGAISDANTAVEASTTADVITTQTAALRAAALTFISSVTAEEGNPFNLMFLASTAPASWQTASGLNPAATAPARSVPKPDASMADFVESYTEAAGGESITGNILYQTLTGMPAGYYTVALYAAASYTPNRGQLVVKCTDGQPNITFGFAGESTLSLPVKHRTTLTAADQVPVNLSVQFASEGDLTFGIKKTAAGSNWHVAQIYTITYSKDPDLTVLKADRDALVSEAEGILASADADLLTEAQNNALQSAINTAKSANTFDDLTAVNLTTLPNAMQTARQQIQQVKENRVLMIAALERFENDYNLADGTDYSRQTMSAAAWTTLLEKVNAVTVALDDVSLASEYAARKDALNEQMDATDASLRLFKSYKAMAEGVCSVTGGTAADSDMDSDDTERTAITNLNDAFIACVTAQDVDFGVPAFLGSNLDFSATEGDALNTDNSNNIHAVAGWEVEYADADTWAVIQTQQENNLGKLYMRKNWGSSATTLIVKKQKMLPVGKYRLTFDWNSNMENMSNRSSYAIDGASVEIGEAGENAMSYDFEVTDHAKTFDLVFGFQKTGTDNAPAQLIVDNVTLSYRRTAEDLLVRDYNPNALWFDATNSKYDGAKNVTVTPVAPNQIIKAAADDQFSNLTQNVIVNDVCDNLVLTDGQPIEVQENFTATAVNNSRRLTMDNDAYTVCLPYSLSSNESVQFYELLSVTDGGTLHFNPVTVTEALKPYLAVAKADASLDATFANVPKTTGEAFTTSADGYSMIGTMAPVSRADAIGMSAYILQSGNQWKKVDADSGEGVYIPSFRAYIVAPTSSRELLSSSFSDASGIVTVGSDVSRQNEEVYDLQGRQIGNRQALNSKLASGLYIVNGKKVVIK
jgi:hypothetical protein